MNTRKLINEYFKDNILRRIDTVKLINHDIIYGKRGSGIESNGYKKQSKVTDAFDEYVKIDKLWYSVIWDIEICFVIENAPVIVDNLPNGTGYSYNEDTLKKLKELYEKDSDKAEPRPPFSPWGIPAQPFYQPKPKCSQCGIALSGVMGYCCPRANCPCGMGPTWCEYRPEESPHSTTITDGTNVCCGGNCSSAGSLP